MRARDLNRKEQEIISTQRGYMVVKGNDIIQKSRFTLSAQQQKVLLYDKPNSKGVVWDICGDTVIDNLLQKSGYMIQYPEAVESDEEFSCCRKKFIMKNLYVGCEDNGEI